MAQKLTLAVALVAVVAVNTVAAFGPYGFDPSLAQAAVAAPAAAAANIDSAKAAGHAIAAENRATDAAIDRATGNVVGAAINERSAYGHSLASNVAAQRSTGEAIMAGGMGGSLGAAAGANIAANVASRSAVGASTLGGVAPGLATPGVGLAPFSGYGAYPGAYGAAYGYPYAAYGPASFAGPMGYGAGMNRLAGAVSTGAALANGFAGSALAPAAGVGAGMGAASRIVGLA